MNDLPSVPNWAVASALAQRTSSASITHPDTTLGRTGVALAASTLLRSGPPVSVLSPSAPPGAPALIETPTPSASPVPSTEEASAARNARTAAVQSVVDRYRDAFDALDANAVEGFWPSADVRALNRAFAQIDTQRFQFDRCDIQLAGARAIASCHGRAEYVRKAGSREARVESRQWTFTLAELKDRWVILGVDARPVR
jgi:hypothetical protein